MMYVIIGLLLLIIALVVIKAGPFEHIHTFKKEEKEPTEVKLKDE